VFSVAKKKGCNFPLFGMMLSFDTIEKIKLQAFKIKPFFAKES